MEGTAAKDPAQGALFLAAQAKRACPSTQDRYSLYNGVANREGKTSWDDI